MKKTAFYITVLCTLLFVVGKAHADTLCIATVSLPPYGYVADGRTQGLIYDIGNAIAVEAGFTPQNRLVTPCTAVQSVIDGSVDMVIMFPTCKLQKHAISLGMILPCEIAVIGRPGMPFRTFDDLRNKRIASIKGAKYDDRLDHCPGLEMTLKNSYTQCVAMLATKQVDAVIGPKRGLLHAAREAGIPDVLLGTPMPLTTAQGTLFVSPSTSDEVRRRIAKAMQAVTLNGTVQALWEKY